MRQIYYLTLDIGEDVPRGFDLRDILAIVGWDRVEAMSWGLAQVDWLGVDAGLVADRVERAEHRAVLMSGADFARTARSIVQTIDGAFAGYESPEASDEFLARWWAVRYFETSSARIEISFSDGSLVEVETDDAEMFGRLRSSLGGA